MKPKSNEEFRNSLKQAEEAEAIKEKIFEEMKQDTEQEAKEQEKTLS